LILGENPPACVVGGSLFLFLLCLCLFIFYWGVMLGGSEYGKSIYHTKKDYMQVVSSGVTK